MPSPGKRDFHGHETLITRRSGSEHSSFPCLSFMRQNVHANAVVVRAPAKVNLFLEVLSKRTDGYHELVTFVVAVNVFDNLVFKEEPSGEIRLVCDEASAPAGRDNLVWRAADLLRRTCGSSQGVHIHLTKRIPMAAGLGGGSSDAAATLLTLNRFWNSRLSVAELVELAGRLGSDVPFFFSTPAAWCTGRGEQVTPFPLAKPLHLVLACPSVGLSTAEVYRQVEVPSKPRSPQALKRALAAGDVEAIGAALHNRLQSVAESRCPEVAALRDLFDSLGPAGHAMSGSGSGYFALCRSQREARELARQVRRRLQNPRPGSEKRPALRVFVVHTLSPRTRDSSGRRTQR